MDIGVRIPHTGFQASPGFIRQWCATAELMGFASLWGVDHIAMPHHIESKYILPREPATIADGAMSRLLSPNFEMMTTLAYVAAITERITIATGIGVLTIRNAVLNARQLATVDQLSGGRLVYGVGVGWLREEAELMNMPWDRRGKRADEHIDLLRALWTAPGDQVEFHGEFWDIPLVDPEPRPVQRPIPIIVGGHSEAAIDRAAERGDGWIAAYMSPNRLIAFLPVLRAALERHDRDPATFTIWCSSRGDTTFDTLRRYQDIGVHSVQLDIETIDKLKLVGEEVLPQLT